MVVHNPFLRPKISWGGGIGWVPLECHEMGTIFLGLVWNMGIDFQNVARFHQQSSGEGTQILEGENQS